MIEFSSGAGALFAAAGLATLAAALLPRVLRHVPISMPVVLLAAGMAGFAFVPSLPDPDPPAYSAFAVHLTEVCVIVPPVIDGTQTRLTRAWASVLYRLIYDPDERPLKVRMRRSF